MTSGEIHEIKKLFIYTVTEIRKETRDFKDEVMRHMSALSEEFHSRLQVVAEQTASLTEDMMMVKETLHELTADMAHVKIILATKVDRDDF